MNIEKLYELTFDNVQDALFLIEVDKSGEDPTFIFRRLNDSYEEKTGLRTEMVAGKTPDEVFDEPLAGKLNENYQRCLSEGQPIRYVEHLQLPEGSGTWKTMLTPMVEDGRVEAILGATRDITDERSLRRELEYFQKAMKQNPDEIYLVDPDTAEFTEVTDSVEDMLGYTRKELLSMKVHEINPSFGEEIDWNQFVEHVKQEGPVRVETQHKRKDGSTFPVEAHVDYTVVDETEKMIVTGRDITERERMEKALKESEQMYRTLFEEATEGFLVESFDDVVLDANKSACEMLGYSSEELQDMDVGEITPPELKQECGTKGIVEYHLEQHGTSLYNWHYLDRDSKKIPVEKSMTPIDYHGMDAVLVCFRDRSKIERVRKKDERKSSFVSQVTHDLRTPLNSITGMSSLLMDTDLTGEQQGYVQMILNAGRSMEQLTNDILDLNRIEQGELILDEERINIHQLLGEVISLYKQELDKRDLMISTKVAEDVPEQLICDPDRLKQILHNLVDNAIKHTKEGTIRIQVDHRSQDGSSLILSFSVSDTGKGIPDHQLDDIFKSHTQVKGDSARSGKGLGIGLSICQNLVELMNGEIEVDSTVGEGTTFTFTVELEEAANQEADTVQFPDVNVLLVEDNDPVRKVFRTYLDSYEITTNECKTGEAALDELTGSDNEQYDVVFLDQRLDDMTGVEVIRQVSKTDHTISPECMYIVTGDPSEKIRELLGSTSCGGVIEKPVDEPTLISAVSSVVSDSYQPDNSDDPDHLLNQIQGQSEGPLRTLVADDDQNTRTLLDELLTPVVDDLAFVENGREAVYQRFAYEPAFVLMDLEMPLMDGLEATEMIRRKEDQKNRTHVPIIFQTARAMKHVEKECLEAGADEFIRKPIKRRRLYRSVLDVLS